MNTPIGMATLVELMDVAGMSTAPLVHIGSYVSTNTLKRQSAQQGEYLLHQHRAMSVVSTVVDGVLYLGIVHLWDWSEDLSQSPPTFEPKEVIAQRWQGGHQIVHSWVGTLCGKQAAMLVNGLPMLQYANPAVLSLTTSCEVLQWDEASKAYFDVRGDRPQ